MESIVGMLCCQANEMREDIIGPQLRGEVLADIDRCVQITTFSKARRYKFCPKKRFDFRIDK